MTIQVENGSVLLSFVVIAYNVEHYIEQCLESIKAQTKDDFEVIVVNDASTDSTASIIESCARDDNRFHVIDKSLNGGAHLARRTGVLSSHGKYVVFVDGDDEVEPTLCEIMTSYARGKDPDILRFGRSLMAVGDDNQRTAYAEEKALNTTFGGVKSGDVIRSVFSEDFPARNTWSVIDCLFKGDFIREAFNGMTDKRLGRMQDAYEFFVLSSRAMSMLTVPEYRGLRYRFGAGVSGNGIESFDRFDNGQQGMHATLRAVEQYALQFGHSEVQQYSNWFKYVMLGIVGREWCMRLSVDDQAEGFRVLRSTWGDKNTAFIILEPLLPRVQSFLDQQVQPADSDDLYRWMSLYDELVLEDINDDVIADKVTDFKNKRIELEGFIRHQKELEIAEQHKKEVERKRLDEEQREAQRVLKKDTCARKLVDRLLPEDSKRRKMLRSISRRLIRFVRH
ncbi:glycosyltransferase family 2 protein [Bifidobacterium tsurumiense]|uniref:Glycosyltransferase, group 2 family protein n=1 Tax=Bifidobacterium tsurumiense TaxID=356829 RepID=A0A087EI21_9BIFI|nr:glycosyltransferase family A protein [Bifidobacterium tsurumiense]KFJ07422.1 glycosyltransferase, group 2 family protein [Bifidobacterium tsurumiense]